MAVFDIRLGLSLFQILDLLDLMEVLFGGKIGLNLKVR